MFFPQGESGNVAVGIVLKMCITLLNENRIPNTVEKFTLIGKSKICYVLHTLSNLQDSGEILCEMWCTCHERK